MLSALQAIDSELSEPSDPMDEYAAQIGKCPHTWGSLEIAGYLKYCRKVRF